MQSPSLPPSRTTCPTSSQAQGPGGRFAHPLGPAGGQEPQGSHDQAPWAGAQTPGAASTTPWTLGPPHHTQSWGCLPPSRPSAGRHTPHGQALLEACSQSRPPTLALLQSGSFYLMGLHRGTRAVSRDTSHGVRGLPARVDRDQQRSSTHPGAQDASHVGPGGAMSGRPSPQGSHGGQTAPSCPQSCLEDLPFPHPTPHGAP